MLRNCAYMFLLSPVLLVIGWHDYTFEECAFAGGWEWWFMIPGLFLYMGAWNLWDRYRAQTKDTLAIRSGWWANFGIVLPFVGVLVPIVRLAIGALVVHGAVLLVHGLLHSAR